MDISLFHFLNGSHAPWLDEVMLFASAVGRSGFLWLSVAIVAALFPRLRMGAFRIGLSVGLALLLVDGILKPLLPRARPFDAVADARVIDQRPTSSSFPSGHAASAMAGALATARVFPAARAIWWGAAALIAVSRVYVGVHFPSDVLAGGLVGFACAWFALGGRLGARAAVRQRVPAVGRQA